MSFWRTEAGQQHRDYLRSDSIARLLVEYEPRGKRAQQQEDFLRGLLLQDVQIWSSAPLGGWPRPRAEVALDIAALSSRNPPRPDALCKWLLDQLDASRGAPVLFTDDRQVTMLYARCDRDAEQTPRICVTAQTASLVREGLRRAGQRSDGSASPDEESAPHGLILGEDGGESWIDLWRNQIEALEILADSNDVTTELRRARLNLCVQVQRVRLALTDTMGNSVVALHALQPRTQQMIDLPYNQNDALDSLLRMPYSYALGQMPVANGSKKAFKNGVRSTFEATVAQDHRAYPLLNAVGATIFFVPSRDGKDLDNIFREILPIMLDVLQPPRNDPNLAQDLDTWEDVASGRRRPPGDPTVSFIEAIALKNVDQDRHPPGSVYLMLSPGTRQESWWRIITDRLDNR